MRAQGLRQGGRKLTVYTSPEGHSAIAKAVEALGLGTRRTCAACRSTATAASASTRCATRSPTIAPRAASAMAVVASAGTVNTGAIDPLDAVADLCAGERVWLHVDGAYGAPAVLDPGHREALAPLARGRLRRARPAQVARRAGRRRRGPRPRRRT